MYKLAVLSAVVAAAQAGILAAPGYAAAGLPLAYNGAYNGYAAGLGYAAPAAYAAGYGYAAPAAYAAAPVAAAAYAHAAPVAVAAAAPAVAPIAYAPQHVETISHQGPPKAYAVPAPRIVEEAPIIEQAVEKVEQHGYSVRY